MKARTYDRIAWIAGTPTKPGACRAMPAKRIHLDGQRTMVRRAGYDPSKGYCIAVSVALALCHGDAEEATALLPLVVEGLEGSRMCRFRDGTGWGSVDTFLEAVGVRCSHRSEELDQTKTGFTRPGWTGRRRYQHRTGYPTLAQWCRENDDVEEAVVRGTGHAGYVKRDAQGNWIVYNIGARKRIDHAAVIRTRKE